MAKINKKRTVDNWKKKKWYTILADPIFDLKEIGQTVSIDSKNLSSRAIDKTLNELTNSIKDSHFKLKFYFDKVVGQKIETKLKLFEAKPGFVKRLVRRGKSKIENIFYVTTKDEHKIKLKVTFITGAKYTTKTRREARNLLVEHFTNEFKQKTLKEALNTIINRNTNSAKKVVSKLGFVNKIVVTKAKVIE